MNRRNSVIFPVMIFMVLLLFCEDSEASFRWKAVVDLKIRPDVVKLNNMAAIDVLLYTVTPQGKKERIKGGSLRVTVTSEKNRENLANFSAVPDGMSDSFGIAWKAERIGKITIEAVYTGEYYESGHMTKTIVVSADPIQTAIEKESATVSESGLSVSDITEEPPPLITLAAQTPAPGEIAQADKAESKPKLTAASLDQSVYGENSPLRESIENYDTDQKMTHNDGEIETLVFLTGQATMLEGQWALSIKIKTLDNQIVDEGDILIQAPRGQLNPGVDGESLISAGIKKPVVYWTSPGGEPTELKVTYFGTTGSGRTYRSSSSTITLD